MNEMKVFLQSPAYDYVYQLLAGNDYCLIFPTRLFSIDDSLKFTADIIQLKTHCSRLLTHVADYKCPPL